MKMRNIVSAHQSSKFGYYLAVSTKIAVVEKLFYINRVYKAA